MDTPWTIIGWGILAAVAFCAGAFTWGFVKALVTQLHADWRRKRAHAGSVKCESGEWVKVYGDERNQILDDKKYIKCPLIATRTTPAGYFCEEHAMENSWRGAVSWAHMLNHAVKEKSA